MARSAGGSKSRQERLYEGQSVGQADLRQMQGGAPPWGGAGHLQ